MQQGLTRQEAEWVLRQEIKMIENDVHPRLIDPTKLNKLPAP